jgi:hypothetical protein
VRRPSEVTTSELTDYDSVYQAARDDDLFNMP